MYPLYGLRFLALPSPVTTRWFVDYVRARLAEIEAARLAPKERRKRDAPLRQPPEDYSLNGVPIGPITAARFWSKVDVRKSNGDCWEWRGAFNGNGYGNFRVPEFGRCSQSAHRVAYRLANGRFPADGLLVRHTCDNPRCVNPHHLEEGTHSDNAMDAVARGRYKPRETAGEKNGYAKLNREKVAEIRRRSAEGETNVSIAKSFGVTHQMISKVKKGHFWKSGNESILHPQCSHKLPTSPCEIRGS